MLLIAFALAAAPISAHCWEQAEFKNKLADEFRRIDTNRDSRLGKEEHAANLRALLAELSDGDPDERSDALDEETEAAFAELDRDANGWVSQAEFSEQTVTRIDVDLDGSSSDDDAAEETCA